MGNSLVIADHFRHEVCGLAVSIEVRCCVDDDVWLSRGSLLRPHSVRSGHRTPAPVIPQQLQQQCQQGVYDLLVVLGGQHSNCGRAIDQFHQLTE